jgi:putative membrane protein
VFDAVLNSLWSGLPALVGQFLTTAGIYGLGLAVYMWLTPYHELRLVRQGNVAAAITLTGAVIGLALPLGATLAHSVSVADIAIWGAVSAVLQALGFGAVSLWLRDLPEKVERGDIAAALLVAAAQLAVGILNAGAMSS